MMVRVWVSIALIVALLSNPYSASANITATGTNPSACNQVVGVTAGVTASRLAGGDCVVEFKNVGSTTWNRPAGVTSVRVLVVGGGGGGASRHAGGGGGGGVLEATSYAISGTVGIVVGGGGSAGVNTSGGTSGSDSRFFANGEATSGATGLIAKGGGFGDFYTTSNNNIVRAGSGGSGGGAGVPNPFTRDVAGTTNADPRGLANQSAQTQRQFNGTNLVSNFSQYGNNGAAGGNDGYWAGGGGGGAGAAGDRGGGAGGTNYIGGAGGAGIEISITQTSTFFGGGGGGGGGFSTVTHAAGAGGSGGGGAGSIGLSTATAGTANTGGGGGGGGYSSGGSATGGVGGSGIVIVRYTPDATAPIFTNSASFFFAENGATSLNAATIILSESVTVTINSGSDSGLFSIVRSDTDTAFIRFLSSPNFEAPSDVDANNVYDISVRATDATGNFTNQNIALTVTNVNEAPIITTHSSNPTHAITQGENISAVATFAATDVDSGTSLTFSISGTDVGDFVINSGSGVLAFANNPDFEAPLDSDTNNIYILTIAASDGALTDTQTLTVAITNANEAGQVTAPTISATPTKGVAITVTVNLNTAGKVRFFVGGKRIASCLSRSTTGSYSTFTATCTWKPAVTGRQFLTATLTPTDSTFTSSTSARSEFWILKRATTR